MPEPRRASVVTRLARAYRTLAVALAWASFAAGAALLALACATALPLLARSPGERALKARGWLGLLLRFYRWLLVALRVFDIQVQNGNRSASGPGVIVANHPTLIDALVILSEFPLAGCIVKSRLARLPILGSLISSLDYVRNEDPALVARCVDQLRAGRSLLLFPEGTRSPAGGLRAFERGAATLSLRSGAPITPIVVSCNPPALGKAEPWYQMAKSRVDLRFRVCYRLEPAGGLEPAEERQVAHEMTRRLQDFFRTQLSLASDEAPLEVLGEASSESPGRQAAAEHVRAT